MIKSGTTGQSPISCHTDINHKGIQEQATKRKLPPIKAALSGLQYMPLQPSHTLAGSPGPGNGLGSHNWNQPGTPYRALRLDMGHAASPRMESATVCCISRLVRTVHDRGWATTLLVIIAVHPGHEPWEGGRETVREYTTGQIMLSEHAKWRPNTAG